MRYTYRHKNNMEYWTDRWTNLPVDFEMSNEEIYPLKSAIEVVKGDKFGKILEAGCGNGRILRYFHNKGFNIHGIDFIRNAIDKIKNADKSLSVSTQSILNTNFNNGEFMYILAFGLYHNLKDEVVPALQETNRILDEKGTLCASFRADNLQNLILDKIADKHKSQSKNLKKFFHKANFSIRDLKKMFFISNFEILSISKEFNMPFLFKLKIFRHKSQKIFNENSGRNIGYKLNFFGNLIFKCLRSLFPSQFCSIYVVKAIPSRK